MKIRLKKGVSATDIPTISGVHKRVSSAFRDNDVIDFTESMPKGLTEYVEEVSTPNKNKNKEKGDK